MLALLLFCAAPPLDPLPAGALARLGTTRLNAGGFHVRFHPDGRRLVAGGWQRGSGLWDMATGRRVGEPLAKRAVLALHPGGR
ncbi:MAG: hypothetical protein K2W96_16580, partial [Gemmataceae bacterium]|nr:hypothetical protein [Gemmataceae bacterium]